VAIMTATQGDKYPC